MSRGTASMPVSRYVALDVHRSYLVVGAVDSQQHLVLSPRRFGARKLCRLGFHPVERGRRGGDVRQRQCLGTLRSTGTAGGPGHRGSSAFR